MVGRVQTKNIPGTIAMVITFTASVFLVHLLRPTPAVKNPDWAHCPTSFLLLPQRVDRIQPGSPLKFAEIEHWPDSPNVAVVVKNISGRAISTFSLAATTKGQKSKIYVSSHSLNLNFPIVLKSGETYSWVLNLDQVAELWVDFVEFSNGTTWGPDTTQTAAALNGERTGARIAALRYRSILSSRGPEAMLSALSKPVDDEQSPLLDHEWKRFFNAGVESVSGDLLAQESSVNDATISGSQEARDAALTERFNKTLDSYLNFRHP